MEQWQVDAVRFQAMRRSPMAPDCFEVEYEHRKDGDEGERKQEEDHARPIFRSLAANGSNDININSVPELFELLGVPYSPDDHALALRRFTKDGCIHEDDFIAWYLDWMFGANEFACEEDDNTESDAGNPMIFARKSPAEIAAEWATFQPAKRLWRCSSCTIANPSCCACQSPNSKAYRESAARDSTASADTTTLPAPLTTEITTNSLPWKCMACMAENTDPSAFRCCDCGIRSPTGLREIEELKRANIGSGASKESGKLSFEGSASATRGFSFDASVKLNAAPPTQGFSFSFEGRETDVVESGFSLGMKTCPKVQTATEHSSEKQPTDKAVSNTADANTFIKVNAGDSDDEQEERRQEEDHVRPIFRSLATNGTSTIIMADAPKLFESLGVPYSQIEHAVALERLARDEHIHEDAFIAWYLDWMFGVNEFDDDDEDCVIDSDAAGASESTPTKKSPAEIAAEWATFQPVDGFWRCTICPVTNSHQEASRCRACHAPNPNSPHDSVDAEAVDWAETPATPEPNLIASVEGSDLVPACIPVDDGDSALIQAMADLTTEAAFSSASGNNAPVICIVQHEEEIRIPVAVTFKLQQAARTRELMARCKITTQDICMFKDSQKPITMVTAYNYPSAVHVDLAGFDILLVDDALGVLELVRYYSQRAIQ